MTRCGVGLVVPQVGRGDLLAEVGDLAAHRVEVQHLLDGLHRRLELLDLGVEVGACHDRQAYATLGRRLAGVGRPGTGTGSGREGTRSAMGDVTGEPHESDSERLTRNLNELLQELRVTQTGVQILTGFLLTLPFTPAVQGARPASSGRRTSRSCAAR